MLSLTAIRCLLTARSSGVGKELDLDATDMAGKLAKILNPPIGLGRRTADRRDQERETVMADFRAGRIHLLIGTTVVEVGVHVPKATVRTIQHPERFRPRAASSIAWSCGRGSDIGVCFLMTFAAAFSDKALSEAQGSGGSHHDGFEIARKDLEHRGYGELIGTKQTGLGELDVSEMMREPDLLFLAKEKADLLLDSEPRLADPQPCSQELCRIHLARPIDL